MKLLDLTLKSPEENLALDEALLDFCERENATDEILRFWEPQEYFVVVGYANKVDVEANRIACEEMKIPILRRCTGGGTVLQGPGCLNYTLILRVENTPLLATVPQTNCFIMQKHAAALRTLLGNNINVRGHTDLALGDLKFSGNAQRRKRDFLIFHGTFLLNFDLDRVEKVLRMPSKEPDYRNGRTHREFLTNVNLTAEKAKTALQQAWSAKEFFGNPCSINQLVEEKYSRPEWNFKF